MFTAKPVTLFEIFDETGDSKGYARKFSNRLKDVDLSKIFSAVVVRKVDGKEVRESSVFVPLLAPLESVDYS